MDNIVSMGREAVILAGGLGTRLREVVDELPKSMAPVNGRPFLSYILDHLSAYNFKRIILATGYKNEAIAGHFGDQGGSRNRRGSSSCFLPC
jgi:D-glycero-alpha-D-manno-heptose 1-phosphate guanylyltransferase